MGETRELVISRLGAQGDGVVENGSDTVYVPFALEGERVSAIVSGERARIVEIREPSPARIEPICRHFGRCGGCTAQHMSPDLYRAWKRDIAVAAYRARGLDVDVAALAMPGGKRRRAAFSAERRDGGIKIGFHEAASHALVAIEECPVLEPKILECLAPLRRLIAPLVADRGETRVTVTWTASGLAVDVDSTERRLSPDLRSRLAKEASEIGLARLSVGTEIACELLPPFLRFGNVEVPLAAGVFAQAVAEAEREIAQRIAAAIGKAKSVADLFCGMGAFTFPLAERARVSAFDGDKSAIAALTAAVKKTTGMKPIVAHARDLFRDPLSVLELNDFDAVVFDPPRIGAEAQARRIAKSKVKTVVAVSCNPATLARDSRHLVDGGYKLESATPIDQFAYTAHIEVVAVFRR